MLTVTLMALFVITQAFKIVAYDLLNTNICFYLMLFVFLMTQTNLIKSSFSKGLFTIQDDTKIELFIAFKSFLMSFIALSYYKSTTFFDYDLEKAHDQTLKRINHIFALSDGRLELPYEFTYSILASALTLISFTSFKLHIKFTYYFFVLNRNAIKEKMQQDPEENAKYIRLRRVLTTNIILAIVILLSFIP